MPTKKQDAPHPTKISLHEKNGVERLFDTHKILYCEADGNYTDIYFLENNQLVKRTMCKQLGDVAIYLLPHGIKRIHHSHLVNFNYLTHFCAAEKFVKLNNDKIVYFSKPYTEVVMSAFIRIV